MLLSPSPVEINKKAMKNFIKPSSFVGLSSSILRIIPHPSPCRLLIELHPGNFIMAECENFLMLR